MPRTTMLRGALIAIAACFSLSAHAVADSPRQLDIPAGDLAAALDALARQSGAELMYSSAQVKGLHTAGVRGDYTAPDAASKLLAGTKVKLKIHESGARLISENDTHAGSAIDPKLSSRVRLALSDTGDAVAAQQGEASGQKAV